MEKIKVSIVFNSYSQTYYATANRGKFVICDFNKSNLCDIWYFNPAVGPSRIPITGGMGDSFPYDYLLSLCKSVWFLHFGTGELPEIELTGAAKKLLKIK
jgi:hypothetical protein